MDLKDIKAIVDLMKKNSITEFELEKQEFKIRLKRGGIAGSNLNYVDDNGLITAQASLAQSLPPLVLPASPHNGDLEIKSPMIGTFYRAPSPESANYAEIGSEVNPESVVCIIEAMKVMNEIKAELRGVVTQILVEGGKPVEFGQPLFKIRPF